MGSRGLGARMSKYQYCSLGRLNASEQQFIRAPYSGFLGSYTTVDRSHGPCSVATLMPQQLKGVCNSIARGFPYPKS